MSNESGADELSNKRPHEAGEDKVDEDPPDVSKKRSRGPDDCLNYEESDEEEFTPYTQANPEVVYESPKKKKVFAKKSVPKRSGGKKPRAKKAVVKSTKSSAASKGKFSGRCFYYLIALMIV